MATKRLYKGRNSPIQAEIDGYGSGSESSDDDIKARIMRVG